MIKVSVARIAAAAYGARSTASRGVVAAIASLDDRNSVQRQVCTRACAGNTLARRLRTETYPTIRR